MSEDGGIVECCLNILLSIGFALLIGWVQQNPLLATILFLCLAIMFLLYFFIKNTQKWSPKEKTNFWKVFAYFIGFLAWTLAIFLGIVSSLPAILGVCVLIGIPIIVLVYYIVRNRIRKREEVIKRALAWELEDQLKGLEEQLSLGAITQEEYRKKKKKLLEKSEA